ncbi:MAG: hypothetical protein JNM70_26580, partial [Anaerolineae bacterium]|nr:hypothetical protein [Anaerolineae bacterium]
GAWSAASVRGWYSGRYRCTRTPRARTLLIELAPRIAEAFAKELHVHGAVLDRARRWLRTGYHVLAGGAVLSGLTLAVALAAGTLP